MNGIHRWVSRDENNENPKVSAGISPNAVHRFACRERRIERKASDATSYRPRAILAPEGASRTGLHREPLLGRHSGARGRAIAGISHKGPLGRQNDAQGAHSVSHLNQNRPSSDILSPEGRLCCIWREKRLSGDSALPPESQRSKQTRELPC